MAVLKRIKFGSTSTPIAMTEVAINSNSSSVLSAVPTNNTENDDANPLYTIALAVDGKTIAKGATGLETSLALKVEAADSTGENPKKARIALVDSDEAELSSVNIEDIVGDGIVESAAYDPATGKLTITWAGSGEDKATEIDLGALLDIQDIIIKSDSTDYLSFTAVDPGTETGGQAQIGVKLADVTFTAASGENPANLTVNATNGKILDASDAIPTIKQYVDAQTTDLAVTAQGDNYITAAQDAENNKKINVSADVQDLTASAGTRGTWAVTDPGDGTAATKALTGETAASISGVADSLADSSDIATKVATYVEGAVAAEAARADAEVDRAIKSLDAADTAASGKFVTAVSETDGKITVSRDNLTDAVLADYAADPTKTGAIAATDTLEQALNKIENTLASTTVRYNVVGTTLVVDGVTPDSTLTA